MCKNIRKILKAILNLPKELVFRLLKSKFHNQVASGPFIGMRYLDTIVSREYFPRLLGTHESELAPIIDQACREAFRRIVNVGAAEGYYSIGMAIRNPQADIIAFEANSQTREILEKMAEINGVSQRVTIRGLCDASLLSDSLSPHAKSLVIMDIEGAESILLDGFIVPELKRSYILVELHDFLSSELGDMIRRRFKETHRITEIWQQVRKVDDFPLKIPRLFLWNRFLVDTMNEERQSRMRWFYLVPLDS